MPKNIAKENHGLEPPKFPFQFILEKVFSSVMFPCPQYSTYM